MPVVIILVVTVILAGLFIAAGFMDINVPQKDAVVEIALPNQKTETAPEIQRPAPATPAGLTSGAVQAPATGGNAE